MMVGGLTDFRKEEAMGTMTRGRTGGICGVLALAIMITASAASADVTTERTGSILILPKIVADGTRDTVIQITNTSNSLVHAHCFYLNGAPVNGPGTPSLWQETDFFIWLTRQQPTHWIASRGRTVNPNDPPGSDGAGLDPGLVPPTAPG